MAILKLILSTDSDCYTVRGNIKTMEDYVINSAYQINKTTVNKVVNGICKELRNTSFEASDVHGTIVDGIFSLSKTEVPEIMNELKSELIYILNTFKLREFNDIIGFKKELGGNQYFKIEIKG